MLKNALDESLVEILESLLVGVMIIDPRERRIVYTNPEAVTIIGIEREELTGRVCHEYICPAAVGACPIIDLDHDIDHSERSVLNLAGKQVPILKSVKKIQYHQRDHLLETFMNIGDIKERERLEGVLEMAGAAAHHIAQPLQAIINCVHSLERNGSTDKTPVLLDLMMTSAIKMGEIVKKLQRITRYQTEEYIDGLRIVDLTQATLPERG